MWRAHPRRIFALVLSLTSGALQAQVALPPGAVSSVSEVRYGSRVALCADTGEPTVQQGAKKVRSTAVWAGTAQSLKRLAAGPGACDLAWSPDGRRLAVAAADGLWVFTADSFEGDRRVEARLPIGSPQINYREFSQPRWSPDGVLIGVLVTNGAGSWVEVFEVATGRLFYTSPPGNSTFRWASARALKLDHDEVRLPTSRR